MSKVTILTIKEAAELVEGLTEFRVRMMCKKGEIPCIMAGRKFLINKDIFLDYLNGGFITNSQPKVESEPETNTEEDEEESFGLSM